ncbi:MAG: NAD(P)/FAD-dependent oxidoreductase [Eubacteriales bacterium]
MSQDAGITIIGEEGVTPYYRCRIPELLAGTANFEQIVYQPGELSPLEGMKWVAGKAAVIMPDRRLVALADGGELPYDRLLVATGASPVRPELPGGGRPGVFSLRSRDDALAAAGALEKAVSAVVLGGGLVSLKAAEALIKRGLSRVTVVVRSPHLMVRQLDNESASLLEKAFSEMGVKFIFGTDAAAILAGPAGGGAGAVLLENGNEIEAQVVITGKGVRPRSELVAQAGGQVGHGIVVDEFLKTSLPGVFAAGDCVEVTDALTGEKVPSGLWPLACEQGRCAAMNMLGRMQPYPPPLTSQNAVRLAGLPLVAAGRRREGDQVVIRRSEPAPGVLKKFFVREDRLLGYVLAGDVTAAGVYTALVRSGRRAPGLARLLAEERLPLGMFIRMF